MAFVFNPFTGLPDVDNATEIGAAIGGATPNSILFIDASGNLAEDNPAFIYDSATDTFSLGTTNFSNGTISESSLSTFKIEQTAAIDGATSFTIGEGSGYLGAECYSQVSNFDLSFATGTGGQCLFKYQADGGDNLPINNDAFYGEFQFHSILPGVSPALWFQSGYNETRVSVGRFIVGNPAAEVDNTNIVVAYDNSDYTNTVGAGSHILMTNDYGSQNVLSSVIGGGLAAKWRTDIAGNISWCSYSPLAPGQYGAHFFWVDGDYADGGKVMMYFNTAGVYVGNNILGVVPATAQFQIAASDGTAGMGSLKFTSGAWLATPEAGVIDWDVNTYENLAFTPVGTQYLIPLIDSGVVNLTSGRVTFATTSGRLTDDEDMTFSGDTLTVKGLVVGTTKLTSYNGVSTVSGGMPSEIATVDLTNQSAAIGATTIYAVPAAGAGMYRLSWVATVTQAATTSSVLGGTNGFQGKYTDNDDSVVKTSVAANSVTSAANTTGTSISGEIVAYCQASTNLQYLFDYTSVGATPMKFNLHIKAERL